MIPLGDDLPTLRRPYVSYAIIAVTFAVWILVQGAGMNPLQLVTSVCDLGMVPGEITGEAPVGSGIPIAQGLQCVIDTQPINWLTPVLSIFLHGSWGHILSNMLFFHVFGNNVEDSMGHVRFAAFYLLCGLAAAATHVVLNPGSPVFPPFFLFFVTAWLVLAWWFVTQVIAGLPELMSVRREVSGGVAVWAHVGGFVAGVVLIKLFARDEMVAAHRRVHGMRYGHGWRG